MSTPRKQKSAQKNAKKMEGAAKPVQEATPALEWILGALGGLLLLASLAFLINRAVSGADEPGAVTIVADQITQTGEAWLVQFTVHNAGTQTLAELHVSARVFDGTSEIDNAQAVIDYLPGRSKRQGGFYLRNDPGAYRLELAPEGFQKP